MRQQLTRLAESSELPNVEVRIYPLNGDHPPLATGAFSYMQFPQVHDVPLHDIVSVEYLEGTYDLEDEEQTYRYRVAFEYLHGTVSGPSAVTLTHIRHGKPKSGHEEPGSAP